MKKSILNFGKALSRIEQQQINGKVNIYFCSGGNAHNTNTRCPVRCTMGYCLL